MVKLGGSITTKHKESFRDDSQKASSTFMKARRNPVTGFITALRTAEGGDYYYQVKVKVHSNSAAGVNVSSVHDVWFPLVEDPSVIAMLYGDRDLIVNSRCRIEYSDVTLHDGQVFIEYDPRRQDIPRKNATELEHKAFLYATAGGRKLL